MRATSNEVTCILDGIVSIEKCEYITLTEKVNKVVSRKELGGVVKQHRESVEDSHAFLYF